MRGRETVVSPTLSLFRRSRPISSTTTLATHGLSNAERRVGERALWRNGFAGAVIVHLLIFFLWWGEAELVSPFAAAGPRAGDNLAASGGMQTVNIRVPPPRPIIRPLVPLLSFDPVPLEELLDEDPQQQIETASILGDRPGVDGPGLPDADGRGDGGTAESGRRRDVPPRVLNLIVPQCPRDACRRPIVVWAFVDEYGQVVADSTRLRPPSSDRATNERLIREAADFRYEPAKRAGKAVASWTSYTVSRGGGG